MWWEAPGAGCGDPPRPPLPQAWGLHNGGARAQKAASTHIRTVRHTARDHLEHLAAWTNPHITKI